MCTKKAFLLFSFFLLFLEGWAQNNRFELKGTARGAKGEPLVAANLQLVNDSSQALVKVEVTGQDGAFVFSNIPGGTYKLMATHYDYGMYTSPAIRVQGNTEVGAIVLPERMVALKEVKIEAQKPFVEQHFDKTVLNVENSIAAAGNTVLEVLEKAPGLAIDQNDNISMRGRAGVMVMINGKRVPMSGAELATMLRGLNASDVAKIDLITNPSAKYDAAGNAGIIDIKLKKDTRLGTNGSISSSFGHGQYAKTNQGLQLNHRRQDLNVFGAYNYAYRKDFTKLDIYREFYTGEGNTYSRAYDQKNRFGYAFNNHNARVGFDYNLSPKTIVGLVASGTLFDIDRTTANNAQVLDNRRQYVSSFVTNATNGAGRNNQSLNVNLKHTLDSTGRELNADLDYASFQSQELQDFTTGYFDLNQNLERAPYLLHGDLDGRLSIRSAKVDYTQPLKELKATLEAGLKSSWVHADNNLEFFDRSQGGNVLDVGKSNHFIYDENINAAYVNANKKWTQWSLQLGLRLENTLAQGRQVAEYAEVLGDREIDRNYTQLFPSAFVGYTLNKKHDLGLSLSRRIDRPTYNQLNPFKFFLDPSTYSVGNPFLKPQLTYSFEFTHTLNQKITTKFSYSRTTDNIVNVLSPDPVVDSVVMQQDRNLAQLDYYGITVSLPITVARWFTSTNNVDMYYGLYQGNLANTNLRNGRPTFSINSNNTFTLPKGWSAEVIGVYRARQIYAFLNVEPVRFLSVGVQKQLWEKKGNVKLNLSDVFYSNRVRATTALTAYSENFYQRRDSRVLTLSFSYRFGGNQVAPTRRRTGGAEEEKQRAG